MTLLFALLSALLVSLISLIGILTLILKDKHLNKIIFFFVSFSAGSLLGGAFFHLIPESLEKSSSSFVFQSVIIGFIVFFILEKILHWHHCQNNHCQEHKKVLGFQNLFGDALHNFIDGLIIVSAFAVDFNLGLITTLSVIVHEIPQEISDFGVLIYSGFSKAKALLYNLFSALFSILGVLIGYFLINSLDQIANFLIPIAAGGFIYIAASDLIPELNKERNWIKSILSLIFFILALITMKTLAH
jgi:zinc and cadmium transporter